MHRFRNSTASFSSAFSGCPWPLLPPSVRHVDHRTIFSRLKPCSPTVGIVVSSTQPWSRPAAFIFFVPKMVVDLDEGLDVVGAVEEGEALAEDGEQDDARGPDVDLGRLLGALEEHLWRAEAPSAGAVGAPRGPGVGLGVALLGPRLAGDARLGAAAADGGALVAEAGPRLGALALGEAKVDEHAAPAGRLVEEVGGLDVAVEDAVLVDGLEGGEEGAQVDGRVPDGHVAEVVAEIGVAEVREDGDDLVGVAEGGDEGQTEGQLRRTWRSSSSL